MRISDWSSDVCSSDLAYIHERYRRPLRERMIRALLAWVLPHPRRFRAALSLARLARPGAPLLWRIKALRPFAAMLTLAPARVPSQAAIARSEEHTSELQSLMRISYAVFCLKKKKTIQHYVSNTKKT